ncbi:MAG: family 20 glycosylhydrolase [Paramuribaculum sp.]|nr:family 20 glycosylhydrolase [Paramuribaculum sp.]
MKKLLIAPVLLLVSCFTILAEISIIPQPVSIKELPGKFILTKESTISYSSDETKEYAEYLAETLGASTGWDLSTVRNIAKGTIRLAIDSKNVKQAEGYILTVMPKTVEIIGADKGGLFYGIQTFLQLFPSKIYSEKRVKGMDWSAPCVEIEDAPERPWRGMMLDVARYFHDKDYVKHFIDMMAMYKMNKLQFHLIDDSGWRLESEKYPRLTEVGAYAGSKEDRLGGYYTKDDIREIIDYAALRNVEIIPEIEFPAHILSAVVAYPWLSCTGLQHELPRQHFISRDLLCVGKESSMQFLKDILDETVELFPSKYINIGGDEAVYTRWEECEDCRALMKKQGLEKASELQGWLTDTVAKMMADKGRTVIGWEEIITRGDVSTPVVALIWHNVSDTTLAIPQGHKAILTPATHTYLDFPEGSTPGEVKSATWMPPISLEKVYSMPVNDYSPESTVIGVQGCLWSDQFIHGTILQEIIPLDENRSEQYIDYLTFPRLMAVAEVGWGKESNRSWPDFRTRTSHHYAKLREKGIGYRVPEPIIKEMKENADGTWSFVLEPSIEGSEIVYTTDGSYPTIHSNGYQGGSVTVESKSDFHAATVDGKRVSLPVYFAPDYTSYSEYGKFVSEWNPLQIQPKPAPWRINLSGKITENGKYVLTFVPTKGQTSVHLGNLKLYKGNELIAESSGDFLLKTGGDPASYNLTVDSFEAGTPFTAVIEQYGSNGNDSSGLIFIK